MIRHRARWPVAVAVHQECKWHVGEEDIGRRLGVEEPNVGDGFTWDSADLDHDKALARQGWETAAELIAAGEHRLRGPRRGHLPLHLGLDRHRRSGGGDPRPAGERQPVVTGRDTTELIDVADTVTEMRKVKHAYDRGISAIRGIEYRALRGPALATGRSAAARPGGGRCGPCPGRRHPAPARGAALARRCRRGSPRQRRPLPRSSTRSASCSPPITALLQPPRSAPWNPATAAMFAAFAEGRSTIRSFARHAGATVEAVDVGIGKPTGDIRYEAAMSEERFAQIVDIAWTAVDALDGDLLVLGEMGIGNTTASAAVVLRWPVGRRRRGSAGARASTTPR